MITSLGAEVKSVHPVSFNHPYMLIGRGSRKKPVATVELGVEFPSVDLSNWCRHWSRWVGRVRSYNVHGPGWQPEMPSVSLLWLL